MRSLHCKLSTVLLSCDNLLILFVAKVSYSANARARAEMRWRELCNENILR